MTTKTTKTTKTLALTSRAKSRSARKPPTPKAVETELAIAAIELELGSGAMAAAETLPTPKAMRLAQLPAAPVEAPAKRKLTKSAARAVVEQIMAKAPVAAEPVAAVEAPKAEPVAIVAPVEPQVAAPKAPKTPRAPKAPQADALMLLCVTYIEQVWASAANKDVAPPVITTETVRDALLELPAAKPLLADKPGDKVWGALSRLRRANLISWSWARPRVRSYGPLAR